MTYHAVEFGTIRTREKSGWGERAREYLGDMDALCQRALDAPGSISCVVVEFPGVGVSETAGAASRAFLPRYGVAVGWALAAIVQFLPAEIPVYTPTVAEWSKGFPGTRGDRYKSRRVACAHDLYRLPPASLGPPTRAGDVADALLLAAWGTRYGPRVLALDPSMTATGYAIATG